MLASEPFEEMRFRKMLAGEAFQEMRFRKILACESYEEMCLCKMLASEAYREHSNNGQKPTHFFVHRLVAKAYIDNPENKLEVHHKDADRKNNCVSNLQWVTREENNQAAWDSGNKKHVVTEKFLAAVRENAKIARSKRMERLTNAA